MNDANSANPENLINAKDGACIRDRKYDKSVASNKSRLYSYLLCALFAAVTAILSQIMIPLPFTPIPINLALLAVWVCGGALGSKKGAIAMLVYILLGVIGVPVFVGFTGGFGVLAGPTGGFIIGYLPSAAVVGALGGLHITVRKKDKAAKNALLRTVRVMPAMLICYICGTAWFMILTGTALLPALFLCVIPFIPGDILKLVAAVLILEALRKPLKAFG